MFRIVQIPRFVLSLFRLFSLKKPKRERKGFALHACRQCLNLSPVSFLFRFKVQSSNSEAARLFSHAATCTHDAGVVVISSTNVMS